MHPGLDESNVVRGHLDPPASIYQCALADSTSFRHVFAMKGASFHKRQAFHCRWHRLQVGKLMVQGTTLPGLAHIDGLTKEEGGRLAGGIRFNFIGHF